MAMVKGVWAFCSFSVLKVVISTIIIVHYGA